ncbi:AMP-binding protein [Brevundimonas sp.]|uniref:AMP-binding protein n=1 Tax=Brevundimonas sp. TaxID=1871086 RepID=UPI003D09D04B
MQAYGLTVDRFLDHAARWHGQVPVVTAGQGEDAVIGYAALKDRAERLSGAFLDMGLVPGDRLATLAWNTRHHVEVWYGAMGVGIVCHTLNPRLTVAHLTAMITEAEDRVLIVGQGLGDLGRELMAACPCIEKLILMDGDAAKMETGARPEIEIEALLAQSGRPATWGGFDENAPAGLCFTSGTTGAPKGVLYSHRANYLSTLRCLQADALALTGSDAVLVAVPMFHANAWGLPFAAAAVGATMVLPGRVTDGKSLARLINAHGVTVAMGVPTVWLGLIDYLDASGEETPTLERVVVGGSGIADALLKRIEDRLGATVQTSWGMTELSPMGTISPPARTPGAARASGRAPVGLDMQLFDANGVALPEQRNVVGHLKVRGHSVVERYYGHEETALDAGGWFDTGDLAEIDDAGNLTLSGRSKDLIKSGGEWINPAEMESIVGAMPSVGLVAVIGRFDARWGERPVMVIEPRQGHAVNDNEVLAALRGKVADWWLPDRIVSVETMPLAATGKINKTQLRATYGAA